MFQVQQTCKAVHWVSAYGQQCAADRGMAKGWAKPSGAGTLWVRTLIGCWCRSACMQITNSVQQRQGRVNLPHCSVAQKRCTTAQGSTGSEQHRQKFRGLARRYITPQSPQAHDRGRKITLSMLRSTYCEQAHSCMSCYALKRANTVK